MRWLARKIHWVRKNDRYHAGFRIFISLGPDHFMHNAAAAYESSISPHVIRFYKYLRLNPWSYYQVEEAYGIEKICSLSWWLRRSNPVVYAKKQTHFTIYLCQLRTPQPLYATPLRFQVPSWGCTFPAASTARLYSTPLSAEQAISASQSVQLQEPSW